MISFNVNGTTKYAVDAGPVIDRFEEWGIDTTLLEKCNSQTLCRMGKIGEGYFLIRRSDFIVSGSLYASPTIDVTFDTDVTNGSVTLAPITLTLYIKDFIGLDIESSNALMVLCTYEEKYLAANVTCTQSYNVVDMLNTYTPAMFDGALSTTTSPQTLEAILTDICSEFSYSIDFTNAAEPPQAPVNVLVGGMPVLDALDYICTAYGFIYEFDHSTNTVFFYADADDFSEANSIFDSQRTGISYPRMNKLFINFPQLRVAVNQPLFTLNQCQADSFYSVSETYTLAGPIISTYFPFAYKHPAGVDPYPDNTSNLQTLFDWLEIRFKKLTTYFENHFAVQQYFNQNYDSRRWMEVTFRDTGKECLTIYNTTSYPFITDPTYIRYQQFRCNEVVYVSGTIGPQAGVDPGNGTATCYRWIYNTDHWEFTSLGSVTVYNISANEMGPGWFLAGWVGDKLVLGGSGGNSPVVVTFTLTSNLTHTELGTATAEVDSVITGTSSSVEEGDTINVYSLGKRRSKIGCVGIGIKTPAGSYLILECQQMALFVKGTLTADNTYTVTDPESGSGLTVSLGAYYTDEDVEIYNPVSLVPYEFNFIDTTKLGPGIKQKNRYRLNAKAGDYCIMQYDAELDEYFLIGVYPLVARRILAKLTQDSPTGCSSGYAHGRTITAEPVYSFDGPLPAAEGFEIIDYYNIAIAGKSGDIAYCEWNHAKQKFHIVQIHRRARFVQFTSSSAWCTGVPTVSSSICTYFGFDGEPFFTSDDIGSNIDNPLSIPGNSGDEVIAIWNPVTKKYSIVARTFNEVTDLRVNGLNLELRKGDTCDWEIWHTGTDCDTV